MSPGMIHILVIFLGVPAGYFAACLWLSRKGKGTTKRIPQIYHFATVNEMLEYRTDILERGDLAMIKSHNLRYVWSGHEWE